MTSSILNISPNPAPTSSPPPPAAPPAPADEGGFSDKLNRAKSKPKPAQAQSKVTAQPTPKSTPAKASADADEPAETSTTQPQTSTANADQTAVAAAPKKASQTEADADEQPAGLKVAKPQTASTELPTAQTVPDSTDKKPTDGKAKQQSGDSAPQVGTQPGTPDLAALATAAQPQSPAAASTGEKTGSQSVQASGDANGDAAPQVKGKPNVSPFKASDDDAAADATAAADAVVSPVTSGAGANKGPAAVKTEVAPEPAIAGAIAPAIPGGVNHAAAATTPLPTAQASDARFAEANHPTMVSNIGGNLLPGGGTMNIRLDPPELGTMQVTVRMENGVMSASFETSNDQATRLLSHTLGQLKTALETAGMNVDRLHAHQSSKSDGETDNGGGQSASDGRSAQQEQQRREMMRRMWRRVSGGEDPLDLVA